MIGKVAAGSPITAVDNIEKTIPINPLNKLVDFFLRVEGDSMINAGILENDLVGVKHSKVAENGQIVVARIDEDVTLKRFYKDSNRVRLVAENNNYKDILVNEEQFFAIEGLAVGIIRENLN